MSPVVSVPQTRRQRSWMLKTPKTQKLDLTGLDVEISPSCDFLLVKMKVGLVYRCFAAGWRAVAK